jgi:hypothetical protein
MVVKDLVVLVVPAGLKANAAKKGKMVTTERMVTMEKTANTVVMVSQVPEALEVLRVLRVVQDPGENAATAVVMVSRVLGEREVPMAKTGMMAKMVVMARMPVRLASPLR